MEKQFHVGIDLLLKRMDSNPDEFLSGGNLWHLVEHNKRWFTKEEKDVIGKKLTEIHMNKFHKDLMAKVLKADERPVAVKSNFGAAQAKAPGTAVNYSAGSTVVANGSAGYAWVSPNDKLSFSHEQIEALKEVMDTIKEANF